jgi:hypothetical protein
VDRQPPPHRLRREFHEALKKQSHRVPIASLLGLNFASGFGVQAVVHERYGESINFSPTSGGKEFYLLASVGNCKLRLIEQSIGLILQATLGGQAADFRPIQISDRVFQFVVASRVVGFHIYHLRSYSCDQYKIFFNLWSNWGAQWTREVENFQREESEQWTTVHHRRNKRKLSYADAVHHRGSLSGPNKVPIGVKQVQPDRSVHGQPSVFDRIIWPKDGDRSRQGRSWHHFRSQFLNHGRNQKLGAVMNKGNSRRLEQSWQSQFSNF